MYICYKYFIHFIIYMALKHILSTSYFVLPFFFFRLAMNSSNSAQRKQQVPRQRIEITKIENP